MIESIYLYFTFPNEHFTQPGTFSKYEINTDTQYWTIEFIQVSTVSTYMEFVGNLFLQFLAFNVFF